MLAAAARAILENAVLIAGIVTAIVIAYIYARQGAAKAWREVADSRQAKIDEILTDNSGLRERVAKLEAQVDHLRQTDQAAVLRELEKHERNAEMRSAETIPLLREIRDELKSRHP